LRRFCLCAPSVAICSEIGFIAIEATNDLLQTLDLSFERCRHRGGPGVHTARSMWDIGGYGLVHGPRTGPVPVVQIAGTARVDPE
jgi:hypothetical protein